MSRIVVAVAATLLLSGCSLTYRDDDGVEHSFGLVHQKIKTTDEMVYIEKNYYGASLSLTPDDGGASLGYKKTVRVFVPEDSVLAIDNQKGEINTNLEKIH
ncbi:hypothetical protein OP492_15450 [Pseudomonas mosselii]|uniref:hypothetical protein n=1 Tax=Pseudomonas mosselii TaxID=78327 RepID=UPI0021A59D9F|nr:hypothetical protein [Pseudomonas mosselii]MEA3236044.1 hypothetical protein [Pseudomonas mosselii]UWS64759.1 hypothetical protein N0U38_13200 [Pseudomonas mosselii]